MLRVSFRVALLLLVLLAAAARFFFAYQVRPVDLGPSPSAYRYLLNPDTEMYLRGTYNLLRHDRIGTVADGPPDARIEPVYVAFLAGTARLTGLSDLRLLGPPVLLLVRRAQAFQILLGALSAGVLALLAREILRDDAAALWAGGLWAVYGPAGYWSIELMREAVFTPLFIAGTSALVLGGRRERAPLLHLGSAALALAAATRADALPVLGLASLWAAATAPPGGRLRRAALPAVYAAVPILLWSARNYAVEGRFAYMVNSGPNFWFGLCWPADEIYTPGHDVYRAFIDRFGYTETDRLLWARALDCLVDRPPSWHLANVAAKARMLFAQYHPRVGVWPWVLGAAAMGGIICGGLRRRYTPLPFLLMTCAIGGVLALVAGRSPVHAVDALYLRDHDLLLAALVGVALAPARGADRALLLGLYAVMVAVSLITVPMYRLRVSYEWTAAVFAAAALRWGPPRLAGAVERLLGAARPAAD